MISGSPVIFESTWDILPGAAGRTTAPFECAVYGVQVAFLGSRPSGSS
jgi:hypothetical protein